MEHIVQFGINIDDKAIKDMIEDNVMEQVTNSIKSDCIRELTGKKNINQWEYKQKVIDIISVATNEFLEIHKDEILEMTANKLVEKLARTKQVKEMVSKSIKKDC